MLHTIIFIVELIKYILFFRGIMDMKIRRYYVALIACGIMVLSVALGVVDGFLWEICNRLGVTVAIFLMLEGTWNRRGIIVTLASLLFVNEKTFGIYFFSDVLGLFTQRYGSDVYTAFHLYQKLYLCAGLLSCFILLFWITIINLRREKQATRQFRKSVLITNKVWTILVIVLVVVSIGTNPTVMFYVLEDSKYVSPMMNFLLYIGDIVVHGLACYIFYVNGKTSDSYETEKMLKETQQVYYEALLAKEEETRRFRHDLANHMVCLQELLETGQADKAGEYIGELQLQMQGQGVNGKAVQRNNEDGKGKQEITKVYITGNQVLDTMLNFYVSKLEVPTEVHVYGRIDREVAASHGALCSIFSNMIKNAVEELNAGDFERPFLYVKITNGTQFVKIEIENTSRDKAVKNGLVKTHKKDKHNHGFGLKNIRSHVESLRGQYEAECKNGRFHLGVYLPLKQ